MPIYYIYMYVSLSLSLSHFSLLLFTPSTMHNVYRSRTKRFFFFFFFFNISAYITTLTEL